LIPDQANVIFPGAKRLTVEVHATTILAMDDKLYHLGFGLSDLGKERPKVALLSGDPERAEHIAVDHFDSHRLLSSHRGLSSYLGTLGESPVLSATSGMGGPSLSIIVNELVQLGIDTIIRVGTSGSIQEHVRCGSVVISSGSFCMQGAANDIAPVAFPAVGDPFLTVDLADAADTLGIEAHVGITASVDTFYEGQGRVGSANPQLLRTHQGILEEYQHLGVLNFEMEAGTLFKMGSVYRFRAGCVCAVIAQRSDSERVILEEKGTAVEHAIQVAVECARNLLNI
jgi:uridine phosphorylase